MLLSIFLPNVVYFVPNVIFLMLNWESSCLVIVYFLSSSSLREKTQNFSLCKLLYLCDYWYETFSQWNFDIFCQWPLSMHFDFWLLLLTCTFLQIKTGINLLVSKEFDTQCYHWVSYFSGGKSLYILPKKKLLPGTSQKFRPVLSNVFLLRD